MLLSDGNPAQRRRGTRIRAQIPVRITSLDPAANFSENCYTMMVNPQGCGVRCTRPLATGLKIRVDELPGRKTALARVANTRQLAAGSKYWIVGLALEAPDNLWCIKPAPADWSAHASAMGPLSGTTSHSTKDERLPTTLTAKQTTL